MKPNPRVIKAVKFEDGTYSINAAGDPFLPGLPGSHSSYGSPSYTQAEALLANAQEQAEQILQDARDEAEALKAQASQEAEALIARAQQDGQQQGYAQGLAAGEDAGQQAVVTAYGEHLSALMAAVEQDVRARQGWMAAQEKDLVKMAVLIAQKILLTELAMSRQSVLKLAAAALKRINDKSAVRLRVHPDDMALVLQAKGPLMLSVDNLTSLEVLGDPGVGLGGCIVETRTGIVDARVATQLAEVATTLLEVPLGDETELGPVVMHAIRALGDTPEAAVSGPVATDWQDEDLWADERPAPAPRRATPTPAPAAEPPREAAPPTELQKTVPALPEVPAEPPLADEEPVEAEAFSQALSRMTDEEITALTAALSELAVPYEQEAPPKRGEAADPSRRAAEALAMRLGQVKKGRGIVKLEEEYDMTQLEGALADADLEAIVRQMKRRTAGEPADIPNNQPLVHRPPTVDAAADALAERLGKKKKTRQNWYDGLEPAEEAPAEPNAGEPPAPELSVASDSLSKLLGKKKKNRPWYEGLE